MSFSLLRIWFLNVISSDNEVTVFLYFFCIAKISRDFALSFVLDCFHIPQVLFSFVFLLSFSRLWSITYLWSYYFFLYFRLALSFALMFKIIYFVIQWACFELGVLLLRCDTVFSIISSMLFWKYFSDSSMSSILCRQLQSFRWARSYISLKSTLWYVLF